MLKNVNFSRIKRLSRRCFHKMGTLIESTFRYLSLLSIILLAEAHFIPAPQPRSGIGTSMAEAASGQDGRGNPQDFPTGSAAAARNAEALFRTIARHAGAVPWKIRRLANPTATTAALSAYHAQALGGGKMRFLCGWGIHKWAKRPATLNPTRVVHRCARCYWVRVTKRP